MKLIYTPEDGDRQEWTVDPNKLTIGEIKLLERSAGQTLGELGDLANRGSFSAMVAFLWIFRRRNEPDLRFDAMDDIPATDISMDMEDEADEGEDPKEEEPPADEEPEPPARPTVVAS